jgi:hypothetical protein
LKSRILILLFLFHISTIPMSVKACHSEGLLKFFEHNEKMTIDITNLAASLHSLTGGSYSVFIPVSECGSKR